MGRVDMDRTPQDKLKHDRYLKLFMANQDKIYAYILMLVTNVQDADDLIQETASTIWEKFDSFKPGSDFAAWAITIARFKVMNYRRSQTKSIIHYSSPTLEAIEAYAGEYVQTELSVREYLKECLGRLSEDDRSLIQMRYSQVATTKALAEKLGRSLHGLYSSLSRIQLLLLECLNRKRSAEEHR